MVGDVCYVAEQIRLTEPHRLAVYVTSRGMMNEHYYVVPKAARAMGTNRVDNSVRLCHAASTVAMKKTLGYGASTCSYRDWIGADLIVFFGSNAPDSQPVTMKYLYYARRAGTNVVVVNPYFEPGLQRYWIPSTMESALFGTRFADEWFAVDIGGDLASLNGVFKILVAEGWIDHDFVSQHALNFEEAKTNVEKQDWDFLERESGATRQEMRRFAELLPTLFADSEFATADGKAHSSAPVPKDRRPEEGIFYLSTRRAKQFNSMVQRAIDPLTGASLNGFSFRGKMLDVSALRTASRFASLPVSEVIVDERRLPKSSKATSRSTGQKATVCYRTRRSMSPPGSPISTRS